MIRIVTAAKIPTPREMAWTLFSLEIFFRRRGFKAGVIRARQYLLKANNVKLLA